MATEGTVREHFVPEEGISLAVLQARLTAWFGPGARIQSKFRLGTDEFGWLVNGGRVTPAILEDLRKETQRREQEAARAQRPSASTVPPIRHTIGATTDQGRTPSNAGRTISSSFNRPTVDQVSNPSRTPPGFDQSQHPANRYTVRTDNPHLSISTGNQPFPPPDQFRHRPTDFIDSPPRESRQQVAAAPISSHNANSLNAHEIKPATSNADPADAAKHPETKFTEDDFQDYTEFLRYLSLRDAHKRSRRHQDVGGFTGEHPPASQPEDAAILPRGQRASRGREDDDDDDDPDYGQQRISQGKSGKIDKGRGAHR